MLTPQIALGTKRGEKQLDEMSMGMNYLKYMSQMPSISKIVSKMKNKTKVIKNIQLQHVQSFQKSTCT